MTYIIIGIIAFLIAVIIFRTLSFRPKKITLTSIEEGKLDINRAAEHLSGAVKIKTISCSDYSKVDWKEFKRLIEYIRMTYPMVHEKLQTEIINEYSILYRWKGKNERALPVLLTAHLDVVPVENGTEGDWSFPPFSGEIADEYVWGRGTLDIKIQAISILEAVEKLVNENFTPERDIYIAFGHDEEVGGDEGAINIAKELESRGLRFEYVLDEGGCVTEGMINEISEPIAVIGIAEKGYANIKLVADGSGGHSSMPPKHTAVGEISQAIVNLEKNQCRTKVIKPIENMLKCIGPHMGFINRMIIANLWIFGPLFKKFFSQSNSGNAMLRTTTAATMLEGSMEPNVLPQRASAVVNFRIAPGETGQDLLEHIRGAIKNNNIKIEPIRLEDPSKVSSVDSFGYKVIDATINKIFPEAISAPYIVLGGTDARKYEEVCENIYRFSPYKIKSSELGAMHGTNECISFENIKKCVSFFIELLQY
ncbi:MAG: hypothetical protein K0R09_1215 [Clostridiales bacterium]|nr:hypothetical protein [Clostridiales bacterium]